MNRPVEFKLAARQRMFRKYGTLAGATAIYGGIFIGIFFIIMIVYSMNLVVKGVFNTVESMQAYIDQTATSFSYTIIYEFAIMIIGAIMSTFAAGVQYMCLKVARNQDVKLSDMFYAIKNNPDKVIIIYLIEQLLMFLFNLPANIIAITVNKLAALGAWEIIYYLFMIFGYAADIIIAALFSQALFIYMDNPQEKSIICIETSIQVMKKNIAMFVKLFVSFIPLYIMIVFTFGIGCIWVLPYQYTVFALFYMKLKGEFGSTIDVTVQ